MDSLPEKFKDFCIDESSERWQEIHSKSRIYTASMVSNCVGCGYESAAMQYDKFLGLREPKVYSSFEKQLLEFGKFYEPYAAEIFFCKMKEWVGCKPGVVWSETIPSIGATTDRILTNIKTGEKSCLEIKCVQNFPVIFAISDKYLIQLTIQIGNLGLHFGFILIWTENCAACYKIIFDEEFYKVIVREVQEFDSLIDNGTRPNRRPKTKSMKNAIDRVRRSAIVQFYNSNK